MINLPEKCPICEAGPEFYEAQIKDNPALTKDAALAQYRMFILTCACQDETHGSVSLFVNTKALTKIHNPILEHPIVAIPLDSITGSLARAWTQRCSKLDSLSDEEKYKIRELTHQQELKQPKFEDIYKRSPGEILQEIRKEEAEYDRSY